MKVLLTGHGGVSGRLSSQCFLKAGRAVVSLDTHLYRSCTGSAVPVFVVVQHLQIGRRSWQSQRVLSVAFSLQVGTTAKKLPRRIVKMSGRRGNWKLGSS